MTPRERIQQSLNHVQPERMPVDFGSTAVTGIHCLIIEKLRKYFDLDPRPVKVHDPYQMLGIIEDDLKAVLGIDTEGVFSRKTMFGYVNEDWKEWAAPWGQRILVGAEFNTTTDERNIYVYPEGDLNAPPSARMPEDGFFFDTIIRQPPLDESNLDPDENLEEFTLIDEEELEFARLAIDQAVEKQRAVVTTFSCTAVGDISLVPAPFLKYPKGIRDITEWYISTVTRQDYLHKVFTKQIDIALHNLERIHDKVGEKIDVIYICGTDFGTQTSSFCSTNTYVELYDPYYKKMNNWIHENTSWKTFKHCCGAIRDFIPYFIESGFDILNPLQFSAAGMDPRTLKKEFGNNIVFWGGVVNTQQTLPFGSPEEVRREVLERCEVLFDNGGFVCNSIHNIQANTPIENVIALFYAINEFNGRKQE